MSYGLLPKWAYDRLLAVLRDDGITYLQYVTELTYLLFLKMTKETGKEDQIPKGYRWDTRTARSVFRRRVTLPR